MTKINDYIKQVNRIRQIAKEYLRLLPAKDSSNVFRLVHSTKFSLEERRKNYEKLKPLISQLEELFRLKVQEMNKSSQLLGYNNYLEDFLALNNIPKKKIQTFLENVDYFISLVHKDYPSTEIIKKGWDWSPVSIPVPMAVFMLPNKFKLPEEIINLISAYDPRLSKNINRIQIEFKEDKGLLISGTEYISDKNMAVIRIPKRLVEHLKVLALVHELGRALDVLDCIDNKITPFSPKYIQEYSAIEFTHTFIKREMSEKDQKYIKYNLLSILANTLFEIDIFANDQQSFSRAYARAINRCYPMAEQTENPLYIFESRLIFRPLDRLIYCMVNIELYLKEANIQNNLR